MEAHEPVEIRPDPPDRVRFAPPSLRKQVGRVCIRIDPATHTLTFSSEVKHWGTAAMRLPDCPEPAQLPELHSVCVATIGAGPSVMKCLVFVDRGGRAIATSGKGDYRVFDAVWPSERLERLENYGIQLLAGVFGSTRRLNKRFPGASRHWYLTTWPYAVAVYAAFMLLMVLVYMAFAG